MQENKPIKAPQKASLSTIFAEKYHVEPAKLFNTLKNTAFKQRDGQAQVSDEQMMALMIVANEYNLNPFTKEIYAFPDKANGIVPIVGVDGWIRMMNENPNFDGIEFKYSDEKVIPKGSDVEAHIWIEASITRKDRSKPIVVREYLSEAYREPFVTRDGKTIKGPWQTHPNRFLRHRASIQCSRLAFGFSGIYEPDEAEAFIERDMGKAQVVENKYEVKALAETENAVIDSEPVENSPIVLATAKQIETIRKLNAGGTFQEADICKSIGIEKLEDMPAAAFATVVGWFDQK